MVKADSSLREVCEELADEIQRGESLEKQLKTLTGKIGEHDLGELREAVKHLEKVQVEQNDKVDNRLKRYERMAAASSGRYKGHFSCADDARAFGLLIHGTVTGQVRSQEMLRSEFPEVSKAFTSTDADPLIPETFDSTVVDLMETFGVFERYARRKPMSSADDHYNKKTGRTSAVPMGEGTVVAESKPVVARKSLLARKWGVYIEVPTEVSEDSIVPVAEMIVEDMAEAHAEALDEAAFNGDGTATYNMITGITNALGAGAIVTGSGNNWDALTLVDFEKAVGLARKKTFTDPRWYCTHQYFWNVMARVTLASGGVTSGEIEGVRRTLMLGAPVEFTQVMPATTAASQIGAIFGNLRAGAVFGDRRALNFKRSEHFKFDEDSVAMLSTRRYDVQIHGGGDATDAEVITAVQTAA